MFEFSIFSASSYWMTVSKSAHVYTIIQRLKLRTFMAILLSGLAFALCGQNEISIDSLLELVKEDQKNGSLQCDSLASLAIEKAEADDAIPQLAEAYYLRGCCSWRNRELRHRKVDLSTARKYYRDLGDSLGVVNSLIDEGTFFRVNSQYKDALNLYRQALEITEEHLPNNYKKQSHINAVLGNVYADLGEPKTALSHIQQAIDIPFAYGDSLIGMNWYGSKAGILISMDTLLSEALLLLENLLKIKSDSLSISITQYNLARCYMQMEDYASAIPYLQAIIAFDQRQNNIYRRLLAMYAMLCEASYKAGNLQLATAAEKNADYYYQAMPSDNNATVQIYFDRMTNYLQAKKDYQKLSALQADIIAHNDKLQKEQFNPQLADALSRYETYKKDQEIKVLNLEAAQNRQLNRLYLLGLSLLAIIALLLGRAYQMQRRQKRLVEENNRKSSQLLSDKEKLLDSLKRTQSQLIQSEKMASIGQMTAGIAHEINNPINFIASSATALQYDVADLQKLLEYVQDVDQSNQDTILPKLLKAKEALDLPFLKQEINDLNQGILSGVDRVSTIIKSLQYLSYTDQGERLAIDIKDPVEASLTILKNEIGGRIQVEKDYGDCPKIEVNPAQINQVILNIIQNGCQAIQGEGTIRIQTSCDGQELVMEIFNDGPAIPEAVQQKIFDPFFTTKGIGEGMGLGLSISYGIIEAHQGQINVRSEEGVGTWFTIRLPY